VGYFNILKPSGSYSDPPATTVIHCLFCIYRFRMILTVNSDHFLKQHQPLDLCDGEELFSLQYGLIS
jgi:hypothetical protein